MVLLLVLVWRWTAPVNHGEFGLLGHFGRTRFHMEITITIVQSHPTVQSHAGWQLIFFITYIPNNILLVFFFIR